MSTTSIKVPVELRDRLAERARHEHTTMAEAIARSLDMAEAAAFWEDVRATMGTEDTARTLAGEIESFSGALSDGLDPDEDWSDIL